MLDSTAGLDRNDSDIDAADSERGGDPGEHIGHWVVAVQEQHVTQHSGAGAITEFASGAVPELLMLGSEPARCSGLDERCCRWHRAGSAPQNFEVESNSRTSLPR